MSNDLKKENEALKKGIEELKSTSNDLKKENEELRAKYAPYEAAAKEEERLATTKVTVIRRHQGKDLEAEAPLCDLPSMKRNGWKLKPKN